LGCAHAKEFAETFGMTYAEIPGSLDYLRRLVRGPWDNDDFVLVERGGALRPTPFMMLHTTALP
jgi:hypothetical protein